MKKKNVKSLRLNKKAISSITQVTVTGGGTHWNTGCLSCADTTADPPPNTIYLSCGTWCGLCKKIKKPD
ncbi:hypothetical protein KAOT1_10911 [Kordia algicida OT-1]|uniref:Uncharacterized protein n=1 Tax=Kordia algicida OT-1 TaxID=391587 RepID=A9E2T7_9FLAO|nr:hypothetical protein KAOT1_10911 [Kordia algicida OT-1]